MGFLSLGISGCYSPFHLASLCINNVKKNADIVQKRKSDIFSTFVLHISLVCYFLVRMKIFLICVLLIKSLCSKLLSYKYSYKLVKKNKCYILCSFIEIELNGILYKVPGFNIN